MLPTLPKLEQPRDWLNKPNWLILTLHNFNSLHGPQIEWGIWGFFAISFYFWLYNISNDFGNAAYLCTPQAPMSYIVPSWGAWPRMTPSLSCCHPSCRCICETLSPCSHDPPQLAASFVKEPPDRNQILKSYSSWLVLITYLAIILVNAFELVSPHFIPPLDIRDLLACSNVTPE